MTETVDVASSVYVDFSTIASGFLTLMAAVITAAIPIILPPILRRLNVASDSDRARRIEAAVTAAAGLAYQYAASQAGGLNHLEVHSAALGRGVDYVNARLPNTLHTMEMGQQAIREMVSARLGVLLAGDPSVSAGMPNRQIATAPIEPVMPVLTPDEAPPPPHPL